MEFTFIRNEKEGMSVPVGGSSEKSEHSLAADSSVENSGTVVKAPTLVLIVPDDKARASKRPKTDSSTAPQLVDCSDAAPRVVDLKLLTSLQDELKYQLYCTWRQLNVTETSDLLENSREIHVEEQAEERVETERCCLLCSCHVSFVRFQEHMETEHGVTESVRNCNSVPVLDVDKQTAWNNINCTVLRRVRLAENSIFCRLCNYYIEPQNTTIAKFLDAHLQSVRHKTAVKLFFFQSEQAFEGRKVLPPYLQNIQEPYTPALLAVEPEQPSRRNVLYHPHEFISSCCCRSAACAYCDTPPFIFASIIPPHTTLVHCKICNGPFVTSPGEQPRDITAHAKSDSHVTKRHVMLMKQGYVPPDTDMFIPCKT